MVPEYRNCTSADGTRISFSTVGSGPLTAYVLADGWTRPQSWSWGDAGGPAFVAALAQSRLVVRYDVRGVGTSQRDCADLALEAQVADVNAVADALELVRFDLSAWHSGSPVAIAYAARHPDRVRHLILWSPYTHATDTRWMDQLAGLAKVDWRLARTFSGLMFPDGPTERQRKYNTILRDALSPEMAARYMTNHLDVTTLAPLIKVKTLVLQVDPEAGSAFVASLIPDARRVVVSGDLEAAAQAGLPIVLEFLGEVAPTGVRSIAAPEGATTGTTIILFADIVDSTALTERLGDAAFRERARGLDGSLRQIIVEAGGTPVDGKLLGDGVLATFPAAHRAIEAGLRCAAAGETAGLPLHLGIHAGDVIREGGTVYGGAVNIASRVSDASAPGEVLVSDIVRGLARTSAGVAFEACGEHALKGVAEAVRLYRVTQRQ